ncbi:MAG TPA: hypothetical protein VHG88_07205 [Burkholderiales bacterium]|nr:hypothetical protein [Burkholderiales bacterium]
MGEIRIAITDDSPAFLAAASDYVARLPGCVIADPDAADLLLLDLGPAPARRLDAVHAASALPGAPVVIGMTLFYSPEAAAAARRAGAAGLIGKDAFVSGLTQVLAALFPAKAA